MDLKQLMDSPPWEWPDDTDIFLLKILRNERADASDRLLAAELAGDYTVINNELADALLTIVRDNREVEELRGEAAISLGPALEHADTMGFDDPDDFLISEEAFSRIQETLQQLYQNTQLPKGLRRRILEASVHAPQDWHHEAVQAAYNDGDELWRLTAVFCMRYLRGYEPQILESLESGDIGIHYQAVCAAGNWGLKSAWPHIAGLLHARDVEKSLLLAAIDATVSIRPEAAVDILSEFIDSEDEEIAEAALEALSMADMVDDYDGGYDEEEDED